MLLSNGVDPTPLREAVLKTVGAESRPVTAAEIMAIVMSQMSINKVTVYRILDLLVDKGLIRRLWAGDRAFRYGMGNCHNHPDHAHFICMQCGAMECMEAGAVPGVMATSKIKGRHLVKRVDVRFEGICGACEQAERR
jgi:Fur family ferric uptake transcriptional regulator